METLPPLPILFTTFFLLIYLLAYFIVFRHWSPKVRPEASSCLISLAQGTPAVFLSASAILSDLPSTGFPAPNTPLQNSVLDFSVAYFLTDLLHYLIFFPSDVLFIAHHLATLFVFLTCRFVASHGALAVLGLLILAEVTSLSKPLDSCQCSPERLGGGGEGICFVFSAVLCGVFDCEGVDWAVVCV